MATTELISTIPARDDDGSGVKIKHYQDGAVMLSQGSDMIFVAPYQIELLRSVLATREMPT
jgi:hypothetical protein